MEGDPASVNGTDPQGHFWVQVSSILFLPHPLGGCPSPHGQSWTVTIKCTFQPAGWEQRKGRTVLPFYVHDLEVVHMDQFSHLIAHKLVTYKGKLKTQSLAGQLFTQQN